MESNPFAEIERLKRSLERVERVLHGAGGGSGIAPSYITETTVTSAVGASAAQDVMSITVTGDGATPIILEWHLGSVAVSAATRVLVEPYTAAGGGGARICVGELFATSSSEINSIHGMSQRITPSGSVTYYLRMRTTAGTAALPSASATNPCFFRARWAP